MRDFNIEFNSNQLLTSDIVALLTQIHEFKGSQNLVFEEKHETIAQLIDIAKIQSTESSNKIEGIYTSDDRLKLIVLDKTNPRTRNEQEIAGYRDVLSTIHENYEYIPLKTSLILQLHRDLFKFCGMSIGGTYKHADNVIAQTDSEGNRHVRFVPLSAWEVPEAMESLCCSYLNAINMGVNPLLAIPVFILDFLCIHPFHDGNGRMSRLLTLLLLYRSGYMFGKYISIEKTIEQSKETYYEALNASSQNWHEGNNDYLPFVRYMLGVFAASCRELSDRIDILTSKNASKPNQVKDIIKNTLGKITKSEIMQQCPDISQVTIQRTLNDLVKSGDIIKLGGGRYTSYTWNREKE